MDDRVLMETVAAFRKELGLTQVEFGVKFKKSHVTIQSYETKNPPPQVEVARLALWAAEVKKPHFAAIFKQAVIDEMEHEVLRLIQEIEHGPSPARQKAPEKGTQHRQKTGS